MSKTLRIGVIGFGWMGQAHSRGCRRAPELLPRSRLRARAGASSATPSRLAATTRSRSFGFQRAVTGLARGRRADPDVDVVFVTAPNMLHVEMVEAAAAAGKPVFCEKPVGGTPRADGRSPSGGRAHAGVITGVGYNYRWAPLVQYAKQLIDNGELGEITNYYGRFFSMYGSDPMGLLSWRFLVDQAGHGVSTDILSHSVDLGHYPRRRRSPRSSAPARRSSSERPLPTSGGTHYDRGQAG